MAIRLKPNLDDLSYLCYNSTDKKADGNVVGEVFLGISRLKESNVTYISRYTSPPAQAGGEIQIREEKAKGQLSTIVQEASGEIVLRLKNPFSGGEKEVRGGQLIIVDDGQQNSKVAVRFNNLVSIE